MTLLGKILVFVNVVFCVFLAAFSLAIYTNHVEWANAEKKIGEVYDLQKEAKQINDGYPAAAAVWLKKREELLARENGRAKQFAGRSADRLWYEQQLRHLRHLATAAKPANDIVYDAAGQPTPDPANFNRPKMAAAKTRDNKENLRSLDAYNKEDRDTLDTLDKKMVAILDFIKADIDATERMNGPKGLKQRLEDERVKGLQVEAEQALVTPQLLDVIARSGITVQREKDLNTRKTELTKALANLDDD